MLPIVAVATSVHIEWDLGDPVDGERRYVEHFPSSSVDCDACVETTEDTSSFNGGDTAPNRPHGLMMMQNRADNAGIGWNESRSMINGNNSEERQHLVDVKGTPPSVRTLKINTISLQFDR